jgi:hypothetical protein
MLGNSFRAPLYCSTGCVIQIRELTSMLYSNILSKEELEALLTPDELEVFIAEQQDRLEHELTLSPAHLLLALRELEDTVGRLTARVEQLEYQLAQKPSQLDPEILQVVNQDIETALFEMPIMGLEDNLILDVTKLEEVEPYIEIQIEPHIDLQMEPNVEEIEEIENIENIENSEAFERGESMLLANEMDTIVEVDQISAASANSIPSPQESSLISRSTRHRERKSSFLSKLLK